MSYVNVKWVSKTSLPVVIRHLDQSDDVVETFTTFRPKVPGHKGALNKGEPDIEIVDGPGRRKPVSVPGRPGIGAFVLSFLFLSFRGFSPPFTPATTGQA
jgi:hypothetical protein